ATLRESQRTLFIAAGLVMLVVFLFLGNARAALIPCLAIPVSVIGSFGVMYLYGFSLNNLSLMALIVAAGLVVDDAIVVLENITRHIERGLSPYRAAIRGSGEVGFTLLAMTLALVAVFVSILFMGGLVEKLFREFSITLAAAMLVSLAVSLTLTPALCSRWLRRRDTAAESRLGRATDRVFSRVREGYARSLGWVLRNAALTLIILLGTIAVTVSLYVRIPKGFLPAQDTGTLFGFARGDDAFSFEMMRPKIEVFRKHILADPAVQDVIGYAGGTSGLSNARMTVRLKPLSERKASANDVVNRLRATAPQVSGGMLYLYGAQDIDPPRMSDGSSYDLAFMASDLELLRTWMPRITGALREVPEIT
ncbi:MAG: efflux RND transporter permease subunit, partial [Opitutaceae bacterium]